MAEIDLYDLSDCPYSKRVRRVLDVLSVDYEETIVPDDKEDRDELERVTGQRGVPVIVDDNHPNGLSGSGEIADYLKSNYN